MGSSPATLQEVNLGGVISSIGKSMEIKNRELQELSLLEVAAVTGGGEPVNNPPGLLATSIAIADDVPVNNPPG